MAMKPATKISLSKYTHSVRAAQAVLQYGVGAMVDFPDQTLMTAAPEYWQGQVTQIHDERLEHLLKVDYLGLPLGQDDPNCDMGISYVRFPQWYFCPKCRKFQPLSDWIKDYKKYGKKNYIEKDPNMISHMQCPMCRQDLVVTRIVTACECGHIDDFPWVKWVHCQNVYGPKPICDNPVLSFKTTATSSEGLEGLTVKCERCGAKATLRGAFDPGKFEELDKKTEGQYGFKCTGRHPWKNIKEKCDKYPRVLQRGSSSVYFPITASSLVIPPYSSIITSQIEDSVAFANCKGNISSFKKNSSIPKELLQTLITGAIDQCSKEISLEIGVPKENILPILKRKWLEQEPNQLYSTSSIKYRAEEFDALTGVSSDKGEGDFVREGTNVGDYNLPGVKGISLIHKIREVQALTGFSRLQPVDDFEDGASSERVVSVKEHETNWYPAYQVRGEGIFIEFDDEVIDKWITKEEDIKKRITVLNENYRKTYNAQQKPREITAKFVLIHTISHLLIKQLSFECGYSIAAIKERLYCGEKEDGKKMAGIFIYTASGDSEGTLGGLVRQGRPDVFPGIYKKAIEAATTCSNDPVCSLSMGQGRDSLNLSACYSCCLIPETSCEEFNILLDRGTVVGTYDNRQMGFYSAQLYEGVPWRETRDTGANAIAYNDKAFCFSPMDEGIDLSEMSYNEIWQSLIEYSDDEQEIALLNSLQSVTDVANLEKPRQDCGFTVSGCTEEYKCDLYWREKRVALFTVDNKDSYDAAMKTDVKCFYTGNDDFDVGSFVDALK